MQLAIMPEDEGLAGCRPQQVEQKLRGDQLYTSLLGVLGVDEQGVASRAAAMGGARAFVRDPRFIFNFVFGYDPSSPREEVAGSIPQALVLMNAPQLKETTMNPANRTMLQVTVDDAAGADEVFDTLMGDAVPPRKMFIQTHAKYVKNLDI